MNNEAEIHQLVTEDIYNYWQWKSNCVPERQTP